MDKKKICIIDVDDTVVDFVSHLCHIHNFLRKDSIDKSDLGNWKFPEALEKTFREYEEWIYLSAPILRKAKKKINELKDKGLGIVLMTARDENFRKQTEFNLALNGIDYDELLFNKNKSLKINRLSEKYDVVLFVDDKLSTVLKVKERTDVPHIYLINMPSNREDDVPEGVERINNLGEVKV
jgi:uncharacterized HAD superfamily protein